MTCMLPRYKQCLGLLVELWLPSTILIVVACCQCSFLMRLRLEDVRDTLPLPRVSRLPVLSFEPERHEHSLAWRHSHRALMSHQLTDVKGPFHVLKQQVQHVRLHITCGS